MKVMRIDYYKELSHTINNYINLIRHDIAINDYSSASICYYKALQIIDFYVYDDKLSNDAYMYFVRRLMFHVKH